MAPVRFYQYDGGAALESSAAISSQPKFPAPEDPRVALTSPQIARYFYHYITELAPWYDLSDESLHFGTTVAEFALDNRLLFSAIIALSAIHVANTTAGTARAAAEFYHGCCIRFLIGLDDAALQTLGGVALATTCLLRSYEILAGASVCISLPFPIKSLRIDLDRSELTRRQRRRIQTAISRVHILWPRSSNFASTVPKMAW